ALCPNLEHGEYQPREDRKGLMVLGRWMMRFSPVVGLDPLDDGEADPTPAVFVDVSGCERLYGGLDVLLREIEKSLKGLALHVTLAIAPTVGAAFALAVSGMHKKIVAWAPRPCFSNSTGEAPVPPLASLSPDVLRI